MYIYMYMYIYTQGSEGETTEGNYSENGDIDQGNMSEEERVIRRLKGKVI
jgi:hypothetical protein